MDVFIQQVINGLVLGSMYALIALGYTMVYGIINLINFAHGEVLMVAALTSWSVIALMQESMTGMPGWVILLIALIIASVVSACLNFTIEKIAYRPLRNSPKLAPLITAIGMSILLQTLAMIIWKPNYKPYPTLLPTTPFHVGGAVISSTQIMILAVTAISLAVLMWIVNATKLGRAMRATAENPRVAALMGVKPDFVISATFVIGAVCIQLRHCASQHGIFARSKSLHRGGVWWHWQPHRCRGRRLVVGADRIDWFGLHRCPDGWRLGQSLRRYFCLHCFDFCIDLEALWFDG